MAEEGTYEYECMRAELLGIDKPDYEEFVRNKAEKEAPQAQNDDLDAEHLKEVELQNESFSHDRGRLDELNSILRSTQKKINNFKASCGSFSGFFKSKLEQLSSSTKLSDDIKPATNDHSHKDTTILESNEKEVVNDKSENGGSAVRKSDLAKALDNQVDFLESLTDKAENAQSSMAHQNNQMKKMLK